MAFSGPRTPAVRTRTNSIPPRFGAGPPTPARGRTPTSSQRDGKPIITVEDLFDRILSELRKDANSLDAASCPGSLRDRVLKLMKGFYSGPRKGKTLDPGDDGQNSSLAKAGINVAELRVEELEAELAQHRMRTAALRAEMSEMQMALESMPKQGRAYARELQEARAVTSFVRTQLADTKAQLRRAEERMLESETQWRMAEERAERAEWRVRNYADEEQWTRLEFVQAPNRQENSESAADGRARRIKARVDREKKALEAKERAAWRPPGPLAKSTEKEKDKREGSNTPRDGGSPAVSVSPRPAPRPGQKERTTSPVPRKQAKPNKGPTDPILCAYCNKPIDGSPAKKQKLQKGEKDSDLTVQEIQKKQKEELDKLKKLEREAADQTAKQMAFRYNRLVTGRLMQRMLVAYRTLVNKAHTKKTQEVVKEKYKNDLEKIKNIEAKTEEQRTANAEKMALAYYHRLCKELQKFMLDEWNKFTIKNKANKKDQEQSQELMQLQTAYAKSADRGGEIAEQVADHWHETQIKQLLNKVVNMWERLTLADRVTKKIEHDLKEMQEQRMEEMQSQQMHSEEHAELMAKKFRAMMNKDLERAVVGCWFRAAMIAARSIKVEQEITTLKVEQKTLMDQYDTLSEEKEEMMVVKMQRQLQKEIARIAFNSWWKLSMKDAAQRRLDKELNDLKALERQHGDEIAEQMANQFKKKLEREIMNQGLKEWSIVTVKGKAQSSTDKDLELLKEQFAKEKEALKEKYESNNQAAANQEMEELKRQLAELEGKEHSEHEEVERLKKELEQSQKMLGDEEEKDRLMEEKRCDQLVSKYHRKLHEMLLERVTGGWLKVTRSAKTEAEKQRMKEQLEKEMNGQLEEMKKQREKEIEELRKHEEEQIKHAVENASDEKKKETERLKEETEKMLMERAERMADAQCKRRNLAFMRDISREWHYAQVTAAAFRAKDANQKELEKLKNTSREQGGFHAEQMAERSYAQYMESVVTTVVRAWQDAAQNAVTERTRRNAEEQLREEKQKQEEILKKERDKMLEEKRKIKREQEEFQNNQMASVNEEMEQLKAKTREKGDQTAELMAENFRKKKEYQVLAFTTNEWQELTMKNSAKREREKQAKEFEEAKKQQEKELAEMKKQYASMDKEKETASRAKEAERMVTLFRKRTNEKLQGKIWSGFMQSMQASKYEREEKQRQEEFNAELERLAKVERAKGDAHAEQMADMQYAKQMDVFMRIITSEWGEATKNIEAERKQEEVKRKHEEEIDRLMQKQREAGDETAEMIADQWQARKMVDLLREVWQGLRFEVVAAHEQRSKNVIQDKEAQLKKLREARAQEVDELNRQQAELEQKLARGEELLQKEQRMQELKKKEHVARADAQAKQMAEQYRQKANLEKINLLFCWWGEEARLTLQAKKEAKLKQAHDKELDELKRQWQADLGSREKNAEIMSERYYKKIVMSLLEEILQAWIRGQELEYAERELQEMKREAARELEELKRKAKFQGDRDAQQLAMQYERKLKADFLRDIFVIWIQSTMEEKAEKQKEQLRKEQQEEILKLEKKEDARQEAERHALVMQYQKKLIQSLMLDMVDLWKDNVELILAEKRTKAAKAEMDAELQKIKAQNRDKGDDTAKMLAERFHKKICYEMTKDTFGAWRRKTAENQAAKHKEKMRREQEDEMNRLKRDQLNRATDQANMIANNFRKKKLEALIMRCMSAWRRGVLETQADKITVKLKRQCEEKLATVQKRVDKLADWTAIKFLESRMGPLVARCLIWWYHRFQLEVVEYEAHLQSQEQQGIFEVDLARMTSVHNSQMNDLSELLVKRKGDTDRWLLLQRTMWGWSEARIAVRGDDFIAKAQRTMDTDTAQLAKQHDRQKRELVITVSEWQLENLKRPTIMCFFLLFTLIAQQKRNQRELDAEIKRLELEAEEAQNARQRRSDFGMARMAEIIESTRNRNLLRKGFGLWRDDHWRESFREIDKIRKQENLKELRKVEAAELRKRLGHLDVLGNFIERLGNIAALRICLRYWYHSAWTLRILNHHHEQINDLQQRHHEEMTEAKEIVETQRNEKQILRGSPKATSEAAGVGQANNGSVLRRGSRGGPKKRLEEGRDSPAADEEPQFKPRLRTSLANRMLDDFDEEGGAKLQDRLSKSKQTRKERLAEAEDEAEVAAEKYAPKKSSSSKEKPTRKRFSFEQSGDIGKQLSFDRRDGSGSSSDV